MKAIPKLIAELRLNIGSFYLGIHEIKNNQIILKCIKGINEFEGHEGTKYPAMQPKHIINIIENINPNTVYTPQQQQENEKFKQWIEKLNENTNHSPS